MKFKKGVTSNGHEYDESGRIIIDEEKLRREQRQLMGDILNDFKKMSIILSGQCDLLKLTKRYF